MAQFARPDGDVSAGPWLPQGSSAETTLWESIDDTTPDDGVTYIEDLNGGNGACEVTLSNVTDPEVATGHIIRFRMQGTGSGGPERCEVKLWEGSVATGSEIATTGVQTSRGAWATKTYTLSAAQANSIGDYTALSFQIISSNLGGTEDMWVTWAEFEVPDAVTDIDINEPESITVADTLTLTITPLLIDVTETIGITEDLTLLSTPMLIDLAESISLADTLTLSITPLLIDVADTIAITDSLVRAITPLIVSLTDAITTADAATVHVIPTWAERWENVAGTDETWDGSTVDSGATLDDDYDTANIGSPPWWSDECMDCITTTDATNCFRSHDLGSQQDVSYVTFDVRIDSHTLDTDTQAFALLSVFDDPAAADGNRLLRVLFQRVTSTTFRFVLQHWGDDTINTPASATELFALDTPYRMGLLWDTINDIVECRVDDTLIEDNFSRTSTRGGVRFFRLGIQANPKTARVQFDNFVIRPDQWDLPTQTKEATSTIVNVQEQFEDATDYDEPWPEEDLGSGNSLDPNADPSSISAPGAWGTEALKVVVGGTANGALKRRNIPRAFDTKLYHHVDYYVESESISNNTDSNIAVLKQSHGGPDEITTNLLIRKDAIRGLFVRLFVSGQGSHPITIPNLTLAAGTFYTFETKVDWDNGWYALWIDGTLYHTGAWLSSWFTEVNWITVGQSGGADALNLTFWYDNYIISELGWPTTPYDNIGVANIINVADSISVTDAEVLALVTDVTIDVAETIAVSDILTLAITPLLVNESDAIGATDALTLAITPLAVDVADVVSVTDALTLAITPMLVNVAESIAVVEAEVVELVGDVAINVADAITTTDALTLAITPLLISEAEAVAVADVLSLAITPLQVDVSESVTLVDVLVLKPDVILLSTVESVTTADALVLAITPLLVDEAEAISIADVLTLAITPLQIDVSDSASLTDVFTLAITPLWIDTSDAIDVTDIANAALTGDVAISVADSITAADVLTLAITPLLVSESEIIGATDILTLAITPLLISEAEAVSLTDVLTLAITPLWIDTSDAISITDDLVITLSGNLVVNVSDAVTVIDVLVLQPDLILLAVEDAVSIADVLVLTITPLLVSVSDDVSVLDVLTLAITPLLVSEADTVSVLDALVLSITPLLVSEAEAVSLTDSLTLAITPLLVSVSEAVSIADALTLTITPLLIDVLESITVSDAAVMSLSGNVLISVSESVSAADVLTLAITPLLVSVSDAVSASDALTLAITPLLVTVADAVTASDAASLSLIFDIEISVTDAVSVADALVFVITPLVVTVAEAVTVTESSNLVVTPLVVRVADAIAVTESLNYYLDPLVISVAELFSVADAAAVAMESSQVGFVSAEIATYASVSLSSKKTRAAVSGRLK